MSDRLARFNALSPDQAEELLLSCAAVDRWAAQITQGRPFSSVSEVLATARSAAEPWTTQETDAALARHPRIGERASGAEAEAVHSRREQSGVDARDAVIAGQLAQGNRAYEQRFGHVFLIRAAGRSAPEILQALQQRLGNDPDTERRIAAQQLREIAVLRLEQELT